MFPRIKILNKYTKNLIKSNIRIIENLMFELIYPLEDDEWGIVCPFGLGDTYFTCGFANEIIKTHGGRKITVFVKSNHSFIPKLFPSISKTVIVKSPFKIRDLGNYDFKTGKLFYSHFIINNITNLIGYKNITLLDCYKAIFKLKNESCLSKPLPISENEYKKAENFLFQNKIPKSKTVILAPESNSIPVINKTFWINLSKELNKIGYTTVANIINHKNNIKGIQNLNIPLEIIRAVSELAGYVISVRSGLCDLLSDVNTSLIVIYPDVEWQGGRLIDGTSLKAMKISKSVKEFVIKENNYKNIICEIISLLKAKNIKQ